MILFLILYIIFWVIYYYFESRKNLFLILWKNSTSEKNISKEQKQLSDNYNNNWKKYNNYNEIIIHIAVTIPLLLIGGSIYAFILLFLLSFSIKWLLFDLLVYKFLGINIHHIDTIHFIDIILRWLEENGISQWVIKLSTVLILLVLSALFLFII